MRFPRAGAAGRFGLLLICACALIRAAAQSGGPRDSLTIYGIRGPSGIGMIRLFEDPPRVPGMELRLEALSQADLVAAQFIAGEAKLGILPANVAAKLASAGRPLAIAAVLGTGMLSLLTDDPSIRSIADLRGKTVEVAGQGATPDYVFRRILRFRGLDPGRDLRLSYALAYPETAQSLIAGRIATALLPEPFATMAKAGKPSLRQIGDIQAEWAEASGKGGNYPMTVLAVDAGFAAAHPGAVGIIMNAIEASIRWVTDHPAEAGALAEKHGMGSRASVAAAIPRSGYVFIPALEARPALEALFRAFLEFAPPSIGGALPPDRFYLAW